MSVMRTLRVLPTMWRIGLYESIAYRAELFIWMLTTTMPLVMLPLWQAVAATGPVGGYDVDRFTAYFLYAFIVRQLTSVWASWTINMEVKQGTLGMRLMRPIHPFWAYAIESLSAIPLRLTIAAPLAIVVLFWTGARYMVDGLAMAAIGLLAIVGAWLISFSANLIFGALSLFTQSSIKLMDVWIAGYFVMSGYLVPLSLFPAIVRNAPYWMPFRYLLGFPVELWSGALSMHEALMQLAAQWTWVVLLGALAALTWNRGLKRFSAGSG